jgi:ABC-type Fe3+-hydroxamate transport system substrate-binding protein
LSKVAVIGNPAATELALAVGLRPVITGEFTAGGGFGVEPPDEPPHATKLNRATKASILIEKIALMMSFP